MTRVICIASGKGGVGKTTVASNIGASLIEFNKKVLVVDANLTTPHLGFHLGVPLYPKTLHDVLRGEAFPEEAIYVHPSGLNVMTAGISIRDLKSKRKKSLDKVVLDLVGEHDIILLDVAAGLGEEGIAGIKAADEMLIVTNPQLPSVTDALKTVKIAEEEGTHILGVVLNRVTGKNSELTIDEVEALLGYPVVSVIPEDHVVHDSLSAKTPVVSYKPNAKSSVEFKKLAASLIGFDYEPPESKGIDFFSKIFSFLKGY